MFGEEVRHARIALGTSQGSLAAAARMSQSKICRIEAGKLKSLSFLDASRVAAAVGLDLFVKAYPSERRPRDIGQMKLLAAFLSNVRGPLRFRTEVPLPSTGLYPDQRAWDAMIDGDGEETAVELEASLYDVQAQTRRIFLKQRDGHPDHLLVIVAGTRSNRRVLAASTDLLPNLRTLKRRDVVAALRAGRHPGTGIVLF
jgi:transcriptional regulator with XRE-family HTH domain